MSTKTSVAISKLRVFQNQFQSKRTELDAVRRNRNEMLKEAVTTANEEYGENGYIELTIEAQIPVADEGDYMKVMCHSCGEWRSFHGSLVQNAKSGISPIFCHADGCDYAMYVLTLQGIAALDSDSQDGLV